MNPLETKKNLEKPLLRRKSDLPTDILTQKSLENYQVLLFLWPSDKADLKPFQMIVSLDVKVKVRSVKIRIPDGVSNL